MNEQTKKTAALSVILMLFCAICLCGGQFIWKYYQGIAALICGFFVYGVGALSMLAAYRFGRVSVLQPINSVSYIISVVLGALFLGEAVTLPKFFGIAFIMLGVILLAREGGK